jgi:hypothetical protein
MISSDELREAAGRSACRHFRLTFCGCPLLWALRDAKKSITFIHGQGGFSMTEMVISTRTLPGPLFRLIQTEKVKVREAHGEIRLTPIRTDLDCPLLGMFADGKISVDKFIAKKQAEKELEP